MRLRNTTDIPNATIREVLKFVMPPGVTNVRVDVQNKNGYHLGGHAEPAIRWHRVLLRIGNGKGTYPCKQQTYQYGQLKGKRYYLANRIECLVYLAAHELRHLWQGRARNKAGYTWGARGRYSEIDTDSYAIRKLREWRRRTSPPQS